ncbi:hypothetical protein AZL_020150 [Azospirillum sp. B510]|uniref:hypothetical protein n=1 Tax=Alphaproteobacteria TaxID=28211 RepID=UPI0001C4C3DA|nr:MULTISPECIES: hypothetical protein [Alphaproteobacteria]BAI71502.1 hypothetical protein AZL_008640 [Azospirillum sp. B510]BAI72653.1 hypothetical protein AZL_020150 [Azospirillum sp. B510]
MAPQRRYPLNDVTPFDLTEFDAAAARILGAGGVTPDIAGPVAALMEVTERCGDIKPERIINVVLLTAYVLGMSALENAHRLEALQLTQKIADGMGKVLAELNRAASGNMGGGRA